MRDLSELRTIAGGLDHPECVTVGPDGTLYAGGEAGQIYRLPVDGGDAEQIATTGGFVLGLCCDARGAIYACDCAVPRVVRIDPSGEVSTYCDTAAGEPLVCPNFNVFEADGTMWLSDSGSEYPAPPDGRLLRIPPGGGDAEVVDLPPLHFPNGLALTPDGALLIVETFHRPGLVRLRDGAVEQVFELPGTVPDGVVVAESGALYVSCYQPNALLRLPPGSGTVETIVDDWMGTQLLTPTNVVFYGADRRSLAIAGVAGWSIRALELPEAGVALNYPEL
jgi:gluconolactonase